MAKLNMRRRWRGPALGGRLQRGVRFCFSAHDGEATTPTLTEWARPEIVHDGRWPTETQKVNQARALRAIGAKKVRRAGNGWVWRLSDNTSLRYQARIVSGRATVATSARTLRPNRWPISASVTRSASDSFNRPFNWAFNIRFSAARYSIRASSSWSTVPVT